MMVLQWCIDIFNVIVEVWLGYWLFNVPKYRRFEQKWVRILEYGCFIGLIGGNILHNRIMGIRFSNNQTIFIVLYVFIALLIFTKRSLLCNLALAGIYYGTISLLELPGIVLSGWLIGEPYLNCTNQSIIYDYIYLLILSLSLLTIYRKWHSVIRKFVDYVITLKNSIIWTSFAIVEWWIMTYFLTIGQTESGRDVFIYNIISIVLILFLLIGLSIFIIYRRAELLRQARQLDKERREWAYEKIKADYRRKSRELHDMKHRILPIEGYLSAKQFDKAIIYVRELLGDISNSQNRIHGWTGNPFIDGYLDSKAQTARKQGIDFHIHVSLLNVGLSDQDTSVLLGNLLDNAVEAAALCIDEKWVHVHIVQKGNMLIIRVKNTFLRPPVEKQGRFESTKIDKNGHGWGLESVRAIVENNNGELKIQYDDKCFEVTIIFLQFKEDNNAKRI